MAGRAWEPGVPNPVGPIRHSAKEGLQENQKGHAWQAARKCSPCRLEPHPKGPKGPEASHGERAWEPRPTRLLWESPSPGVSMLTSRGKSQTLQIQAQAQAAGSPHVELSFTLGDW